MTLSTLSRRVGGFVRNTSLAMSEARSHEYERPVSIRAALILEWAARIVTVLVVPIVGWFVSSIRAEISKEADSRLEADKEIRAEIRRVDVTREIASVEAALQASIADRQAIHSEIRLLNEKVDRILERLASPR